MAKNETRAMRKPRGGKRALAPTKDETVEVSGGGADLLTNLPATADLLHHYKTIKGFKEKAATASGHLAAAKKTAREAGIDTGMIDKLMSLERDDPLSVKTYFAQMSALMSGLGMPTQIVMFETRFGSIEDQATAEGLAAGRAARTPDGARWGEGKPGHDAYMAAWQKGQDENAAKLSSGPDRGDGAEFDQLAPQGGHADPPPPAEGASQQAEA